MTVLGYLRSLTWPGRATVGLLAAWVAWTALSLLLTGCSTGPKQREVAAVVAHLEYVPASQHVEQECTGAVPMVCSERTILEKQCWRVDVRRTYELLAETGYTDTGRYVERGDRWNELEAVCVFPSELAALKVGDPWVAPEVPYKPGVTG